MYLYEVKEKVKWHNRKEHPFQSNYGRKFGYRERLETTYRTPYGMLQIETYTKELHVSLKDRPTAGKVMIEYDLLMGPEKLGEYYLTLDFTA